MAGEKSARNGGAAETDRPTQSRPSALVRFRDSFCYYAKGLYNRVDDHHVFLLASGLTFSLFTCIVPLILVIFAIIGTVLEISTVKTQLDALVIALLPSYSSEIMTIFNERVDEMVSYRNVAGILGGVGLLFMASGLFSAMRTALDEIFKVDSGRTIARDKLHDFKMVLLVMTYFLVSTLLLPLFEVGASFVDKIEALRFLRGATPSGFLISVFSLVLVYSLFFLLYYAIPSKRIGLKTAARCALWTAIAWELAKKAFSYYLANFATLDRIYGAYVFAIVVALWIYYSAILFLIGAEIGQLYRERRDTAVA